MDVLSNPAARSTLAWERKLLRYANLGVGFGHPAFRRGDIRSPLEELRGTPRGIGGGVACIGAKGSENVDAGWPVNIAIACSR